MKITYILVGHVARQQYHQTILDKLPKPLSSIDDGSLGVYGNSRQAWQLLPKNTDYGVFIQDDVILTDHFVEKTRYFLETYTTLFYPRITSFYYGYDRPQEYIEPDYFEADLYHGVCYALPKKHIDSIIEYCDRQTIYGEDMRLNRWLIANNQTCLYSNPSLVQHRTDLPSIDNPNKKPRHSNIFLQHNN